MRLALVFLAVLFAVFSCCSAVLADSWGMPTHRTFYSADRSFYVEIWPRVIESQLQYFEDKTRDKERAGSRQGARPCWGTLYKAGSAGNPTRKVWSLPLRNEVAPVEALVANDGQYVVTLDNWHNVGYGDNVVVVYDSQGGVKWSFPLSALASEEEIFLMRRTISSIWWHEKASIDETPKVLEIELLLDYDAPRELSQLLGYKTSTLRPSKVVKIDLTTGDVAR